MAGRVFHSWNPGIRSYLALGSRARQGKGVNSMAITSFTRFKGDKAEEMVKAAKQAKKIVEKHGAEFFRIVPVSQNEGKPPNGRYIEPWRGMC